MICWRAGPLLAVIGKIDSVGSTGRAGPAPAPPLVWFGLTLPPWRGRDAALARRCRTTRHMEWMGVDRGTLAICLDGHSELLLYSGA